MKGIELLVEEHENIRRAIGQIKKECVAILDGKEVNVAWFRRMIEFCRNYADKYHHGKEEKILFRIMLEELGSTAEKLVRNGMLVEHDLGRYHIAQLEQALDRYEQESVSEIKLEILANAFEYASLLDRHIEKENTIAYTYAERSLSDVAKEKVEQETLLFEASGDNEMAHELLKWLQKECVD